MLYPGKLASSATTLEGKFIAIEREKERVRSSKMLTVFSAEYVLFV